MSSHGNVVSALMRRGLDGLLLDRVMPRLSGKDLRSFRLVCTRWNRWVKDYVWGTQAGR